MIFYPLPAYDCAVCGHLCRLFLNPNQEKKSASHDNRVLLLQIYWHRLNGSCLWNWKTWRRFLPTLCLTVPMSHFLQFSKFEKLVPHSTRDENRRRLSEITGRHIELVGIAVMMQVSVPDVLGSNLSKNAGILSSWFFSVSPIIIVLKFVIHELFLHSTLLNLNTESVVNKSEKK
jgi:hypothetical protein